MFNCPTSSVSLAGVILPAVGGEVEADPAGWSEARESTEIHELCRCLVSLVLRGTADVSSNHYTVSNCYPKRCDHICFLCVF